MNAAPAKTRFAPSPTGLLHLGNVRTALFNYLLARAQGGVFLLRIEDTDAIRGEQRYIDAIREDLAWLGLDWQEGEGVGGPNGPYRQSERRPIYQRHYEALQGAGRVYPCFCTEHELQLERRTQQAAGRPPRYSGRCYRLSPAEARERLAAGAPAALRFHVADEAVVSFADRVRGPQRFSGADIGDFIVRRSDGTPAFFFSNAVDDALMGVTLVVRGEDHLTNTPRQILLLQALGLAVPEYAHIALVVGADGAPLSKRHGSRALAELREQGFLPLAIANYLARVGHSYEDAGFMEFQALAERFEIGRLQRAPARFDEAQLRHWQQEAVRRLEAPAFWRWAGPACAARVPEAGREAFAAAVRPNVGFPQDARHWAGIIFGGDWQPGHAAREVIREAGAGFFDQALAVLAGSGGEFAALARALGAATGARGKALFQPLRAALTGESDGPELARLLPLITVARARERLERARAIAAGP